MTTTTRLLVRAITPDDLESIRNSGLDGRGNELRSFTAQRPGRILRCCLRYAESAEQITLISHAPFGHRSCGRK